MVQRLEKVYFGLFGVLLQYLPHRYDNIFHQLSAFSVGDILSSTKTAASPVLLGRG